MEDIISSTGDFTIPHPKAEEKFAGSTRGPSRKFEGNPTIKITALNKTAVKHKNKQPYKAVFNRLILLPEPERNKE